MGAIEILVTYVCVYNISNALDTLCPIECKRESLKLTPKTVESKSGIAQMIIMKEFQTDAVADIEGSLLRPPPHLGDGLYTPSLTVLLICDNRTALWMATPSPVYLFKIQTRKTWYSQYSK